MRDKRLEPEAVVAIGASAGGIPALCELMSAFSCDATAFVVTMHLSPDHESRLAAILAPCTQLNVVRARSNQALERDTIYVIPEGFDVLLSSASELSLVPPHESRPRRTIDHFFRSVAQHRGASGAGVILSGAGFDGSHGLKAIRDAGGATFVQDPVSAEFAGMPRNALEHADHIGAPRALGRALMVLLDGKPCGADPR